MKTATFARSSGSTPAGAGAQTMKAVVQDAYGSSAVLRLAQITTPASPTTRCSCASTQQDWTGEPGI